MTSKRGYQASDSNEPPPGLSEKLPVRTFSSERVLSRTLTSKERELQQLLANPHVSPVDRERAEVELASLAWLREHWDDVQHNARCLKDFSAWLRTPPSRSKLFGAYCRHAVPCEWDDYLETDRPPFIFPSPEKFQAHMEHCQLCAAQVQLAEGRRRGDSAGERTWGDQMVLDFFTTFCSDAFAAVCDPSPREPTGRANSDVVWREIPTWRLVLPTTGRAPLPLDRIARGIPTRLMGPENSGAIEVCISAQLIRAADRQAEPLQFVLGDRPGEFVRFDWRPGRDRAMECPVSPVVEHGGRMILRYAVRPSNNGTSLESIGGALTLDIGEYPAPDKIR